MTKLRCRLFFKLFLVLGVSQMQGLVLAKEALVFCFESADVRPWRTVDAKGLNFELLNAAANQAGVTVTYEGLPWKRCLSELKANNYDGAFAASFSPDRMEIGAFPGGETLDTSKRLHTDGYVVLRKKGSAVGWDGKAFSSLEGAAVGIQLGYSVGAQLKAMKLPVDDGSTGLRDLVQKLVAQRVGAVAIGGSDAKYLAKLDPNLAQQVEILPVPLVEKPYFLMLSHRLVESKPALANSLWTAIEKERVSVRYQRKEENALSDIRR